MIISSTKEAAVTRLTVVKRPITPERWVINRAARHGWLLVVALIGSIGAIALYSVGAVQIGQLIEAVVQGRVNQGQLQQLCLVLLAVLAGRGLVALIGSLSAQTLAQRLERDVRDEVFTNLVGKSQTFHNRQKTGDLMARTVNDVDAVSGMVYPGSTMILDSLINAVMPLIAIALLDARLLAMPVIFLLLFTLSIQRYSKKLDSVSGTARWRFGALNGKVAEAINAFETIKAARQEARVEQKILGLATEYRALMQKQGRMQGGYLPTLIYGICFALGVGHALWLGLDGLELGVIVGFVGLFGQLRYPMSISSYSFWLLSWGRGAVERIQKLLETDAAESSGGHAQTLRGQFKLEQVGLEFNQNDILNEIDLEIKPGETVALVGPTGSGKTLLSQLLNRTYEPSRGQIWIDGLEASRWDLTSLRSQIALIEQDVFLFARSVAENIAFGQQGATRDQIKAAARAAQADEFIRQLPNGYDTILGERGVTLSGGQRQRLAIARALLVNAPVLVLDDATSAIDSVTEEALRTAIQNAARNRTTLVITNRLSQVQWADRIVLMQRGRIVAQGCHEDLIQSNTLYQQLFATTVNAEVTA
jgi:ATP-binding cassette, subfamily B, bacterial